MKEIGSDAEFGYELDAGTITVDERVKQKFFRISQGNKSLNFRSEYIIM